MIHRSVDCPGANPMDLKFSIIVPSFNQGMFIARTIDSVLGQSYQNIEVMVIDGGSADGTIDILKSYGDRILWVSEPDRGQTHAINKGLALAKGDIIAYLNSDDFYLNETLARVAAVFRQHEDVLWLTGDYIIVDETGKKIQSAIATYKTFFRKRLSFNMLTVINPIIQPSTFFRKVLVDRVGFFNEDLKYTMDYEYWLRAIKMKQPFVLNEELSAFRIHKASKGGSKYSQQFSEQLDVARKHQDNQFLIFMHTLHNHLVKLVYFFLK